MTGTHVNLILSEVHQATFRYFDVGMFMTATFPRHLATVPQTGFGDLNIPHTFRGRKPTKDKNFENYGTTAKTHMFFSFMKQLLDEIYHEPK